MLGTWQRRRIGRVGNKSRLISLSLRRLALANNKSNEVLLTDVSKVVDRVLLPNVKSNDYSNTQVGVLDWSTEPEAIDWKAIRCFIRISDTQWLTERRQIDRGEHVLRPPFDLVSAECVRNTSNSVHIDSNNGYLVRAYTNASTAQAYQLPSQSIRPQQGTNWIGKARFSTDR